MYEQRLLERIKALEDNAAYVPGSDISQAISSITSHLQRMLNTRKGSVMIDKDYGIPDFTNSPSDSLNELGRKIAEEIKEFIQKYEPRLGNVKVSFIEDEEDVLSLKFKLEGELVFKGRLPVTFETWMDQNGRIVVSG
ncbi:MAG: type VI secretion system baseplate subunit TssE [Desulfonauticus sp.]|nr:type VI secretion system baseplate subunit TssE [Desulfonauticus sp.]